MSVRENGGELKSSYHSNCDMTSQVSINIKLVIYLHCECLHVQCEFCAMRQARDVSNVLEYKPVL